MASPGPGPGDPDEQYDFLFKLVLVGDASVGKTCVVQRFKTGAFSERQGSTIGVDFTMKTLEIQGKRVKVGGLCGGPWKVVPQQAGRGQMGQSFLQIPECCFPPPPFFSPEQARGLGVWAGFKYSERRFGGGVREAGGPGLRSSHAGGILPPKITSPVENSL